MFILGKPRSETYLPSVAWDIHTCSMVRTRCCREGCTNEAVQGGVCITHGAGMRQWSQERRCLSQAWCNRCARKGGVCITHGAKVTQKRCNHEGCTKQARTGGVCATLGAVAKCCNHEGCTKHAKKGGVCCRHYLMMSVVRTQKIQLNNSSLLRKRDMRPWQ